MAPPAPDVDSFQPQFGAYYPKGLRQRFLELEVEKPFVKQQPEANIDWIFNYDRYVERTEKRVKAGNLATEVPRGWPARLTNSSLDWSKGNPVAEGEYVYTLSEGEVKEIEMALEGVQGLDCVGDITKANFNLPTFGKVLEDMKHEVHNGRGFAVIRGLDPRKYSPDQNTRIFLGISSHIAEKRGRQTDNGQMISHVMNAFGDDKTKLKTGAPIHTNVAQPFHTDLVCDILALYWQNRGTEGGESKIASVQKIYNFLATHRPDIIDTLSRPDWPFDTWGRIPAYHERPLLFCEDGKVILNYARRNLTTSPHTPRTPGVPVLNEAQADALDTLEALAQRFCVETPVTNGDMTFVNNLAVVHAREAYQDSPENKRYMLRLWLRNEEFAWKLPKGLQIPWERVYGEDDEIDERWPIGPRLELENRLRCAIKRPGSCSNGSLLL